MRRPVTKQRLHTIASVLIVASLALIATGANGAAILWQIGLGALALAMALSFATHWARSRDES